MGFARFLPFAAVGLALLVPVPALAHGHGQPAQARAEHAEHHAKRHPAKRHHVSRPKLHRRARQPRRSLTAHITVLRARVQRVLTHAPVISGVTYFVSPLGSDGNSGLSPAAAWRTVGRVNRAVLVPGDGVLFQGGATFSDSDLEPGSSGSAAAAIVFGSYGQGQAVLALGVWFVQNDLTFDDLRLGATFYGGSQVHGSSNGVRLENCTIALPAGNSSLGVYGNGDDWVIENNTISGTGLSGLLLNGDRYVVSGNTITNTGLDTSVPYNAHGIYLDASDATVTQNTITNFAESGVSARYRNSTITQNTISGGQIGIDFYQTDPTAGTSTWTQNTITNTTAAGIYISPAGVYPTHESFTITANTLTPTTGVFTNLHRTSGTYRVARNSFR